MNSIKARIASLQAIATQKRNGAIMTLLENSAGAGGMNLFIRLRKHENQRSSA